MSSHLEIRTFSQKLATRSVKKNGYLETGLQGYAAVYGVESRDMGGWKEVLVRGAFKNSLKRGLDVRMLYQHDTKQVLARESAGNLTLREDSEGLYFEADLLDTAFNRDVVANVAARNLDAMSFGMPYSSVKTKWDRSADGKTAIRNVTEADVVEISVVTWPAYEETTVQARCAEELQTFLRQDAAKSTSVGMLRARHELAKRRFRY
jgi:HK97 family phage prohead protease